MIAGQEMWTPLEAALSPFKELARLNRQTVTGAEGEALQLVLAASRCRVEQGEAGAEARPPAIELGFSLAGDAYAVRFVDADYRRDGRWNFEQIRADISAGLRSGALQPGTPLLIAPGA
ncbi:MAG TPA: hypothetical protein VMM93_03415 [Vicinamibacterales bacterium]|nr:hypothetical protein [Vicinamibacterales bacterium]